MNSTPTAKLSAKEIKIIREQYELSMADAKKVLYRVVYEQEKEAAKTLEQKVEFLMKYALPDNLKFNFHLEKIYEDYKESLKS